MKLLSFYVHDTNFRSVDTNNELCTQFSLVPTKKFRSRNSFLDFRPNTKNKKLSALPFAAFYGADMRYSTQYLNSLMRGVFLINCSSSHLSDLVLSENNVSYYGFQFEIDGKLYEYNFSVKQEDTTPKVCFEQLFVGSKELFHLSETKPLGEIQLKADDKYKHILEFFRTFVFYDKHVQHVFDNEDEDFSEGYYREYLDYVEEFCQSCDVVRLSKTQTYLRSLAGIFYEHRDKIIVVPGFLEEFHPKLSNDILRWFRTHCNGQILFSTNNVNFLDGVLRTDEIFFVDHLCKEVYSLHDFRDVGYFLKYNRLSQAYLNGRFDAIPYVSLWNMPKYVEDDE